ncbi:4-hydroxy-tetrahydrodipicolinate synthase [Caproiciproducens galactitolivorans]|uniref:4-hydroxy-tetrahydrodipicolinate synthase n=1 Tax=Caproiciproducens galactitolivorans TaxID=642589 RepID=A0A4Z0YAJ3_9FIRM|nr:4-hydroxy-tetrahydrodipicolinate synthase [Caproiciproducens galactitolivorans]QEY34080.1 4-hydroxy-tetrahydrodipicolinate synthase [Caproiciproducens galactitolivorans]TGJ76505.1 4-hydroxy-tetrahydrodipicolinate synthase [Caproiciproducens galactitolivorans]
MKKLIFEGSGVALVTPMKDDGSVDYEVLDELIEFHIANGTDAIIACGTTGECAVLSHDEHCDVVKFIIDKVNKRIPVIASSGSNDTRYALELSRSMQELGADGLLMVTPYYNKTSQAGLVKHYTYIADRVDLPIIVYNVPSRTGCNIKPETYLELSKHPNINATKEANGDISSVARTIALCEDNLHVYSGNDDQTLPMLALGGKGVISVLANILPGVMHKLCADYFAGNIASSRDAFLKNIELMQAMFMDVNPIPVKAAMKILGFKSGDCRLPLTVMSDEALLKLTAIMKKYNLVK